MAKDNNGPALPRPLYQCAAPTTFVVKDHNAGLWYDKFVNCWKGTSWNQAKANKLGWINTVIGHVGCPKLIAEFANRQRQLAERSNGKAFVLTTESRFATGLGREHPIENGFAWHHTLGTPYLPGSSIKGLIRNWAEQWDGQTKQEANAVLGGPGCVGRVLLLDALPMQPPALEADVMTPHYGDYYQKGEAPGDWLSPTPIPFLVVGAGESFQFAVLPNSAADAHHVTTVGDWLFEALQWLGAGAKTAVGYGRFARDEVAEARVRDADAAERHALIERTAAEAAKQANLARLAALPPDVAAVVRRAEAESWSAGPSAFMQGLPAFLDQNPSPSAAVIEWIRVNCIEPHWKAAWANPTGSAAKKLKEKQMVLLRRLRKLAGLADE